MPHGLVHVEAIHRDALQFVVAVVGARRVIRVDPHVAQLDGRVERVRFRRFRGKGDEAEGPGADAKVDKDVVDAQAVGQGLDEAVPLGQELGEVDFA